ncbi:MAG TPA: TfuA-like protein [Acidimicrobiales bacterium]|nr:TfuA-like protein [Acidimicrobiales bacterium]
MSTVVFLGPSLPVDEARAIVDATYLPPARQSHVLDAVIHRAPTRIGLIDGEFFQSLSVWHKEILFAIERGVEVYGASSMGALRAAECSAFGMVGVGDIYDQYADGRLTDDDEVALLYEFEAGAYRRLTEPMVNVRATVGAAVAAGAIDDAVAQHTLVVAKGIYFQERTLARLWSDLIESGIPRSVVAVIGDVFASDYVDVKRNDAIKLLGILRERMEAPDQTPPPPSFQLQRTSHFDTLYNRDRAPASTGAPVAFEDVANHVALHDPDFDDVNFSALNRALVLVLADLLQVDPTAGDVDAEVSRLRARKGLESADAFDKWLAANDMAAEEFRDLATQLALCRRLHRWFLVARWMDRSTKVVLDELRLRGSYEEWVARASSHARLVAEAGSHIDVAAFSGIPIEEMLDAHSAWTDLPAVDDVSRWLQEVGFHNEAALRMELVSARLARDSLLRMVAGSASADDPVPADAPPP